MDSAKLNDILVSGAGGDHEQVEAAHPQLEPDALAALDHLRRLPPPRPVTHPGDTLFVTPPRGNAPTHYRATGLLYAMAMKKIAILIPYFGHWPRWFGWFLETCRHNPTIDWLFFADCNPPPNAPGNVHFNRMTLEGFNQRASDKLNLDINITRPYKICDLRPAFAVIFEEELKDYDFWAWGDTDVLYGNIRQFLTKSRLDKYDVIGLRRYFTSGMLTLLRNTKKVNRLYEASADYEKVFTAGVGYAFDEVGKFKDRRVESITDVVKSKKKEGQINALFWEPTRTDRKIPDSFEYYWKDGRLYDLEYGEQFALYHFLDRKRDPEFVIPSEVRVDRGFYISIKGIREADTPHHVRKRVLPLLFKRSLNGLRRIRYKFEV